MNKDRKQKELKALVMSDAFAEVLKGIAEMRYTNNDLVGTVDSCEGNLAVKVAEQCGFVRGLDSVILLIENLIGAKVNSDE